RIFDGWRFLACDRDIQHVKIQIATLHEQLNSGMCSIGGIVYTADVYDEKYELDTHQYVCAILTLRGRYCPDDLFGKSGLWREFLVLLFVDHFGVCSLNRRVAS